MKGLAKRIANKLDAHWFSIRFTTYVIGTALYFAIIKRSPKAAIVYMECVSELTEKYRDHLQLRFTQIKLELGTEEVKRRLNS